MIDRTRTDNRHRLYVRDGWCPAVHWSRVWCTRRAGHAGYRHMSLAVRPDGTLTEGILWD